MLTPQPEQERRAGLFRGVVLNLAVLVLATLLLNAILVWNLGSKDRWQQREWLAVQTATVVAEQVEGVLLQHDGALSEEVTAPVTALVEDVHLGQLAPSTVTVVGTSLQVIARAGEAPEDPLSPADLREAVATGHAVTGVESSRSSFWGPRYVYASVPVELGARKVGGVRVTYTVGSSRTWLLDWKLAVFAGYIAVAILVVTLFGTAIFRNRILHPIRVLVVGTRKVAEGMFSVRVPEDEPTEIGDLAVSFNLMAEELGRYQSRSEEQVGELQHINELLERTRDELAFQARMAGVGRLAAGVAHEIGNPLAAVIGMVELLSEDDGMDADTRSDLLRRIGDELQRVHATVRDLLDYARPAEGDLEPVDLATVIQSAREMVSMQRDFDGVEVVVEVPEDLPRAHAEPSRLRQVLINLLLNARDAVAGVGRVVIRARRSDGRCFVEVIDDGQGVPPEHEDSIFDPFFTTKEPGEGTGLGLSVSLQIVEGFGGRLRYRRAKGGGASFTVELPAA